MSPQSVELASSVTQRGGVWRHMADLAAELLARDVDVVMTLPDTASELLEEARRLGCRSHRSTPADTFHLHLADTYDAAARPALVAARRRGQTTVVTEHLPRSNASDPRVAARPPRPGATLMKTVRKRRQLAHADAVVAVSRASADFLHDRYGPLSTSVHAVPNGIRTTDRPGPDRRSGGGPGRYVAIGSIIEQKGFDRLLTAAREAQRPWHVDVLGQGPHLERLREQARRHVLDDGSPRVRFRGWQDAPDEFVRDADALVLPSRWESAPYVVLEAMDAGLAVVSTRVDGPSEQVVDRVTGTFVDGDGPSIARALDWGVDHRPELAAWGAAGRDRVARSFDLASAIDGTVDVYAAAAKGRRRS